MSNMVRFSCTALAGTQKKGVLKPDDEGCYNQVVGALNVFNSVGQWYDFQQSKALFEQSSQFMRRVRGGKLGGEQGHPKWLPGMTEQQYATRLLSIYEENQCCIHKEIMLDFDNVKDDAGRPVIAIISRIKPAGPHGAALRESFEDPDQNVCFSIRAFTDDYEDRSMRGVTQRALRTIVTWDKVTEPGIAVAEKYKSPALENLIERDFSRGTIMRGIEADRRAGIATESATLTAQELFSSMGWDVRPGNKPGWLTW